MIICQNLSTVFCSGFFPLTKFTLFQDRPAEFACFRQSFKGIHVFFTILRQSLVHWRNLWGFLRTFDEIHVISRLSDIILSKMYVFLSDSLTNMVCFPRSFNRIRVFLWFYDEIRVFLSDILNKCRFFKVSLLNLQFFNFLRSFGRVSSFFFFNNIRTHLINWLWNWWFEKFDKYSFHLLCNLSVEFVRFYNLLTIFCSFW